jgi:hypothetical protein
MLADALARQQGQQEGDVIPQNGAPPPSVPEAEISFIDRVPVWVFPLAAAVVVGGVYWYTS